MKKVISCLLVLTLLCAFAPAALAANDDAIAAADTLHALGLFNGKGDLPDGSPDYDLDTPPTRNEAVTMLVRLLGKEAEAQAGAWDTPFTDLVEWAAPYVGYAYTYGLTNGTSETTFSGGDLVTAAQYLTFVLRALGYESGADFNWYEAWTLSDSLGVTGGEYDDGNNASFLRGDVASVSLRALTVRQKGSDDTLAWKLMAEGVFTVERYASAASGSLTDAYAPETVYRKMLTMQAVLPEGMRWTNEKEYILEYDFDDNGVPTHMTYYGYGCVAFGLIVSSAAFGDLPVRMLERGTFTFEQLRPGDMLRTGNNTHTVIILEIFDDAVVVAEGNYNASVHWGRVLTREQVMNADHVETRYPDAWAA